MSGQYLITRKIKGKIVRYILRIICTILALGLSACASSKSATIQVDLESLPSNKDQVAKTLSADLQSRLGSSESFIFDPKSENFICAAELVERQILTDAKELLDYQIEPSSHRVFLAVTGRKAHLFASASIVETNKLNSYFEPLVGLQYQIKDGCDSVLSVRRDDY